MGSQGWAQCDWCWDWRFNMYVQDDGLSLCRACLELACAGDGPPWWPNETQRWSRRVQRLFRRQLRHDSPIPIAVCNIIAAFVARPFMP